MAENTFSLAKLVHVSQTGAIYPNRGSKHSTSSAFRHFGNGKKDNSAAPARGPGTGISHKKGVDVTVIFSIETRHG